MKITEPHCLWSRNCWWAAVGGGGGRRWWAAAVRVEALLMIVGRVELAGEGG